MRLNIVIDDNLMQQARLVSGLTSEQEIVETAFRCLITTKQHTQCLSNPAKALLESDFIGCGTVAPYGQ